jgi:hypothetical protein
VLPRSADPSSFLSGVGEHSARFQCYGRRTAGRVEIQRGREWGVCRHNEAACGPFDGAASSTVAAVAAAADPVTSWYAQAEVWQAAIVEKATSKVEKARRENARCRSYLSYTLHPQPVGGGKRVVPVAASGRAPNPVATLDHR